MRAWAWWALCAGWTARALALELVGIALHSDGEAVRVHSLASGVLGVDGFRVGVRLQLDLAMDETQYRTLVDTHQVCIQVNARTCKCYDGDLLSTTLLLDEHCAPASGWSQLWVSAAFVVETGLVSSSPLLLVNYESGSAERVAADASKLTLLLPLTIDDVARGALLLHTLRAVPAGVVLELQVYCPDRQQDLLLGLLTGLAAQLTFPVFVSAESTLFLSAHEQWSADPYALQMAIKLVAAAHVRTTHYVTLDADVLLLRPLARRLLFAQAKAIYRAEHWSTHAHWWEGSRAMLGLPTHVPDSAAFGVTPAVLSTWGSLITLEAVRAALCRDQAEACLDWQQRWVTSLGRGALWTEYTLYRSALDRIGVFDELHVTEQALGTALSCDEVWYAADWPWVRESALGNASCLFSLVQSSTQIRVSAILAQLLP